MEDAEAFFRGLPDFRDSREQLPALLEYLSSMLESEGGGAAVASQGKLATLWGTVKRAEE